MSEKNVNRLSLLLKAARKQRKITQQQLGSQICGSASSGQVYVSRYESGLIMPSAQRLGQIASALRINPKKLGEAIMKWD